MIRASIKPQYSEVIGPNRRMNQLPELPFVDIDIDIDIAYSLHFTVLYTRIVVKARPRRKSRTDRAVHKSHFPRLLNGMKCHFGLIKRNRNSGDQAKIYCKQQQIKNRCEQINLMTVNWRSICTLSWYFQSNGQWLSSFVRLLSSCFLRRDSIGRHWQRHTIQFLFTHECSGNVWWNQTSGRECIIEIVGTTRKPMTGIISFLNIHSKQTERNAMHVE